MERYGGRAFERELLEFEFLYSIGAEATVSDRMVFKWKWGGQVLKALAHVDDIIYNGSGDEILDEFFRLAEKWFKKLTGGTTAEYILGIKIEWDLKKCSVKLSQRAHVEKFLTEFGYAFPAGALELKEESGGDAKKQRHGREHEYTKKKDTPMQGDIEVLPNTGRRVLACEWDTFKWVGVC